MVDGIGDHTDVQIRNWQEQALQNPYDFEEVCSRAAKEPQTIVSLSETAAVERISKGDGGPLFEGIPVSIASSKQEEVLIALFMYVS